MTTDELYAAIASAHETVMNFTERQIRDALRSGLLDRRVCKDWEERHGYRLSA